MTVVKVMREKNFFLIAKIMLLVFLLSDYSVALCSELNGEWKYHEGDLLVAEDKAELWLQSAIANDQEWKSFDFPHQPPLSVNTNVVWLTTTLPKGQYISPLLFFTTTEQSFRVYLDKKMIYQYGDLQYKRFSYGMSWHMVALPEEYEGKNLTFQMYSNYPDRLGIFDRMMLDDSVRQTIRLFQYDAMYVVAFPVTIFMILIMICYYLSMHKHYKLHVYAMIFFSFFALWLVAASNTKLLFLNFPVIWWYLLLLSVYSMPIFLNLTVYEVIEDNKKKKIKLVVAYYIVLALIAIIGECIGLSTMNYLLSPFYISGGIVQSYVAYQLAVSAYRGNEDSKVLLIGLMGLPLAALYDGLGAHFRIVPWVTHVTPLGIFAFAFFILRILSYNVRKEQELTDLALNLQDEIAVVTQKSQIDDLTKCYNRNKFNEALEKEVALSSHNASPLSMLMIDIDFFKRINDTYGHDIGDEVLIRFTEVIRTKLDKRHIFIRYGGEEFIILCRDSDKEEASQLAELIRRTVEDSILLEDEKITCSIGVSQWRNTGTNNGNFLKRSDLALYAAKNRGRNKVIVEDEI